MYQLLKPMMDPADLKPLTPDERSRLCVEIRDFLLSSVAATGGHLASNLGIVELTVALHTVFQSPVDKLLFDVGHQTYVHKLLTGRMEAFATLRRENGLSGFLKRHESIHDVFEAGHSTTSISAALGFVVARDLLEEDHDVVAVIGDGAMTGGMAYEAMNLAGHQGANLKIILNDNEMSIDGNIGSIARYLEKLTLSTPYTQFKASARKGLTSIPKIGPDLMKPLAKFKDSLKYFLIPGVFFEELGIKYIGPVDGHDVEDLIDHLRRLKGYDKPVLLHVKTQKGKGYGHAEKNPDLYHGVGTFDPKVGVVVDPHKAPDYSAVAGKALYQKAKGDRRVVAITAAMPGGTGLEPIKNHLPDQYIDVGIAEQNAVTLAAGLAAGGGRPFVAVYSTFLQRAYDQVLHDVALQNLPVRILIDRAGIVGQDGETHQGTFDVGFLTPIPQMTLWAPKDAGELVRMIEEEALVDGPLAIRYPRGKALDLCPSTGDLFQPEILTRGQDLLLLSVGHMASAVAEAVRRLKEEGIAASHVSLRCLKPLPLATLATLVAAHQKTFVVEDHQSAGGIAEQLAARLDHPVVGLGIGDSFVRHGTQEELYRSLGLDGEGIYRRVKAHLETVTSRERKAAR